MKKYAVDGLDVYPNELAHMLDDALELNAELLAALKAAKPFVICLCQNEYQCQGCGIDKAIATVNKAIAKA